MKIVIAGASGFIGSRLCARLKRSGHEIVALERHRSSLDNVGRIAHWDGKTADSWVEELDGADVLINLSGKSIAVPWTPKNREDIWESRIGTTQLLGEACKLVSAPPRVWINSSAIGVYRPNLEEALDENGPGDDGFVGRLAREWESALFNPELPETRRVAIRTGIVFGQGGGAFDVYVKLVKWFVGGSAGSGKQWMSWIHVEDLIRIYEWAINSKIDGPINACAPEPKRNGVFMAELRRAYGRPWAPPAPAFAIKLFGMLGGPHPSLALDGYRVIPKKASEAGFEFRFPTLKEALRDLVPKT